MRNIWLVRHGMREDFENPAWRRSAQRPDDTPLSATGLRQAQETAEFLKSSGIQAIYCSPFLRAIQTADIIAAALGVSVRIEDGLSEWLNPLWFEKHPETISLDEARALFRSLNTEHIPFVRPTFPEPEIAVDFAARIEQVLQAILQQPYEVVALVAHGAVVEYVTKVLCGHNEGVNCGMCAVTHLSRQGDRWVMECSSDGHLSVTEQQQRLQ